MCLKVLLLQLMHACMLAAALSSDSKGYQCSAQITSSGWYMAAERSDRVLSDKSLFTSSMRSRDPQSSLCYNLVWAPSKHAKNLLEIA